MPQPAAPKIYHIVHVDRLPSVIADGQLWCDEQIIARKPPGTVIGMNSIKQRRLTQLKLTSHPDLFVGQCVPFYFCPRSIMLYLIHCNNHPEMVCRGGQGPIVHLECDLHRTAAWAEQNNHRWAFTLSNAVFVNKVVRFDHAASLVLGTPSARSGFSQTAPTGCQLRACRDQRAGLAARASA